MMYKTLVQTNVVIVVYNFYVITVINNLKLLIGVN